MKHVAYAEKTSVSVERSRSEIETVVRKYGATHYAYVSEPGRESIQFLCRDRKIRFVLELPLITDKQFRLDGRGKVRTGQAQFAAWEQGCRQKWRALLLSIKAKLEAVRAGISEFEEEFLAFVVDPDSEQTVYEAIREPLKQRYLGGSDKRPLLLGGPAVEVVS